MSDQQTPPLIHADTEWVFGTLAGVFAWIATIIFTAVFLYFLATAYRASETFNANLTEVATSSKIELSSRLLRIKGIDVASVAEFLESKTPNEVIVTADTQEASDQAKRIIESHRSARRFVTGANVFGIAVTRASVFCAFMGWLAVTCMTLAVAGRRRVWVPFG